VAEDEVGNRAAVAFVDKFFPKPFSSDRITLDDAFLNKVVPEIREKTPVAGKLGSAAFPFSGPAPSTAGKTAAKPAGAAGKKAAAKGAAPKKAPPKPKRR
jgi:hypothetical protein